MPIIPTKTRAEYPKEAITAATIPKVAFLTRVEAMAFAVIHFGHEHAVQRRILYGWVRRWIGASGTPLMAPSSLLRKGSPFRDPRQHRRKVAGRGSAGSHRARPVTQVL